MIRLLKQYSMKLSEINFPVYWIDSEEIHTIDNVVFVNGQVLDNKNVKKETLGERRVLWICSSE